MKKKRKPYLKFYLRCLKTGNLTCKDGSRYNTGLCWAILREGLDTEVLGLFQPTIEDFKNYPINRYVGGASYWGSGDGSPKYGEFTELRQTIVLFLAAMHGEL